MSAVYHARWDAVPGLRQQCLTADIYRRAPLFLGLVSLNYAIFGKASVVGTALLAGFCYGLQSIASYAASLIIMPGGRETVARLRQAKESKLLQRIISTEELAPVVNMLSRMQEQLEPARRSLLDLGRLKLGSSERLELVSPDGVQMDGVLLGGDRLRSIVAARTGSSADDERLGCRGVMIYCGGNGEHYELRPDLIADWGQKYRLSLLLFNYRGVGLSGAAQGRRCERTGGVLDTVTVLAYLRDKLGVPANRIIVVGHSIGGGYASEACTFFPGVLCINDRSFGRLSTVALYHVLSPVVDGPYSTAPWAAVTRSLFIFILRHVACWELDTALHWSSLPRSCKAVVYSSDDLVIPVPAQLLSILMMGPPLPNGLGTIIEMTRRRQGEDAHNGPWTSSECDRIDGVIARFLKGHPLGDRA